MNISYINRLIELLPEDNRLVRQAKSGDTSAFVHLYDAYVERVYRYIHFLAPNNRVAEGLTFQVFFKAWGQLDRYQIIFGSSFVAWLYSIAQNQVIVYYRTHKKTIASDNEFILAAMGGNFREEFQAIRVALQFLTAEQRQALVLKFIVGMPNKNIARVMKKYEGDVRVLQLLALQALAEYLKETELQVNAKGFQPILEEYLTRLPNGAPILDEYLARYPEHAAQLKPLLETALLLYLGRDVKPSPTFNAYTHDALVQYVRSHPQRPHIIMPVFQRAALTFAMLVAAFLVTGTAHSQSALPGDTFYTWKRTSEQVWSAISFNPVATDIMLTERRLNEWIAVANDPTRSANTANAMKGYLETLAKLKSTGNAETITLIVPVLQSQQQTLSDAGLSTSELDDYLGVVVSAIATSTRASPTEVLPTAASMSTLVIPTVAIPTEIVPTATAIVIVPTATAIVPTATMIVPTATVIIPTATVIVPTATVVIPTATAIVPTETAVPPTEIVPTATVVIPTATAIVPTETAVPPTEIVPTETPVPPTEIVPTEIPTEAVPTEALTENAPTIMPNIETTPTVETR